MKFLLKNPAPSDSRRKKWGDYHFGRSLGNELQRRGHEVATHYDPGWDAEEQADVVLLLRGKYPFPPSKQHSGALRVIWNISHPADVSDEEYASHDVICVASRPWAEELQQRLGRPVHALLQCTDTTEFRPPPPNAERRRAVFIGNTRDVHRPAVLWALDYGLDLRIWGRGWQAFDVPERQMEGDYHPNEQLGDLYASSRFTFNDHWEDMKEHGFVNNRIFDALACGLPVISDWHSELVELLPGDAVLTYRDHDEFVDCITRMLLQYPSVLGAAREASEFVRGEFSFQRRTDELLTVIEAA